MMRNLTVMMGTVIALFALGLFTGPAHLPWEQEWAALTGADQGPSSTIMWRLRLPRLVVAVLSGAALGLSGLLMQTYFRNPLAGPSVLGVTSGSTLGVALVALGGATIGWAPQWLGMAPQVAGALFGGGGVMLLLGAVMGQFRSRTALLIFGLMVGYLGGAMVTVLQAGADAGALQAFVHWGMGSFAHGGWTAIGVLGSFLVPALIWTSRNGSSLDMWSLGPLTARSMGVDERRLSWGTLGMAGAMAAVVTAWCGPIAFLGLATPHLVRAAGIHGRHRVMVPHVALTGAALALLADALVRHGGIPLNAVLSMVGAPIVLFLIVGRTAPGKTTPIGD